MAKPKPDLPPAESVYALADADGRLPVRVTPGARVETLELAEGKLLVKVRAKPQDGAANDAVRKLVATALGVPPSSLQLLRGATSREKLFQIGG